MNRRPPAGPRTSSLAEEHRRLGNRIGTVRELLQTEFSWDDARLALAGLQERLNTHFTLEEDGGYLAEVLAVAPQHAPAVAKLASEHDRLRMRIALLVGEALVAHTRESLRENVADFFVRLLDHARREDEIVQATFATDSPACD